MTRILQFSSGGRSIGGRPFDGSASRADRSHRVRAGLWAGVFGAAGVLHFVRPEVFDNLVPEELPGTQRGWTYGSGVAELGLSAAMLSTFVKPEWRPAVGKTAAAFLLGVWPGNIKMAWDWRNKPAKPRAIAFARVPLQVPMIRGVLKLAK